MKGTILPLTLFLCCLKPSFAQLPNTDTFAQLDKNVEAAVDDGSLSDLPNIQYHLTARPWHPLNISRNKYLDKVEGVVREIVKFQNSTGAIIDPFAKREVQYTTPYFASAIGTLLSAGRANDLLSQGIAAMNIATAHVASGAPAIPDNHGEFYLAPLAGAIPLYAPYVSATQLQIWKTRMATPIEKIIRGRTHNWRTYAMKGEWLRAKSGYINKDAAVSWIENSWIESQRNRLTNNSWDFYHDDSSDPDSWPYESAARSNLLAMITDGYDGSSRNEILRCLKRGSRSSLLFQDPTGQVAAGGRSGNHTWNDMLLANGYETMAEISYKEGKARLAGQYRHAAALAFNSIERWRRSDHTYFVTKNHFNPKLRVRYASYSFFANYNCNVIYPMAENYLRHKASIAEEAAPNEIGGYTILSDRKLATAIANAGGMHMEVCLRGSTSLAFDRYWTTLGVVRFARPGWDSRLGPSDGVRDEAKNYGVSFAPTFLEGGKWVRLASMPERYEAFFTTQFAHPLLVRCRVKYKPKSGYTGPTFTNDFVITPDGVLSTLTSTSANFGITWPILTFDGETYLNTGISSHIASTSFSPGTDQQNFIALHSSPIIVATDSTRRSSYGDLRPVRMVSGTTSNMTFVYPRNSNDPSAEAVRKSFTGSANNFSTILGKIEGNIYVGRTSAGGVGTSIDIDNDNIADAVFNKSTGFILQLKGGEIVKAEADRDVTAVIYGQTINLTAYTPVDISNPSITKISKVIASTDDGNVPINTIDGDDTTQWAARGNKQWIRYYLNTTEIIKTIKISWYHGDERQATFDIQTSLDSTNWSTVYSGHSSGTTSSFETYNIPGKPVRYIRIMCHGNNLDEWNAITELKLLKDTNVKTEVEALKTGFWKGEAAYSRNANINDYNNYGLRISPNPNKGIFDIQTSSGWADAQLTIYDLTGKVVLKRNINETAVRINLSYLQKGVYALKLSKKDKALARKIILQ